MSKRKKGILAGVAGGVLIAAAIFVWHLIQIADEAERQIISMKYVANATLMFIDANKRWPQSWKDLAGTLAPGSLTPDIEWEERLVTVDFDIDLKAVASQSAATFSGFRPKKEPFYDYSAYYTQIIERARKVTGGAIDQTSAP